MPLATYLLDIRNKQSNKPFTSSFTRRETAFRDPDSLLNSCRESGISVSTLHGNGHQIDYRCATYSILESVIYYSRSTTGYVLQGDLIFDGYSLSMPRIGRVRWHTGNEAVDNESGCGSIQDLQNLQKAEISAESECDGLIFSSNSLVRELSTLLDSPVRERLKFRTEIPVGSHALMVIRSIMGIIACGLENSAPLRKAPIALVNLNQAILYILLQKLQHNYSDLLGNPFPPPTPRDIKRAIEFINANLSEPITLNDVAESASISVRTLQTGFKKFRGISPMAYLKTQRLEGVKRDLLNCDIQGSVEQIALAWGFTHFYLFMRNYEKAFGESPRTTFSKR